MVVILTMTFLFFNDLSADSKRGVQGIAFVGITGEDEELLNRQIYLMDTDGKNIRNLTNNKSDIEELPSWSPDGTQIAFVSNNPISGWGWGMYIMDADGQNKRQLTTLSVEYTHPAWSPDSKKIAFSSRTSVDNHDNNIYVVDVTPDPITPSQQTDINLTRLTNDPASAKWPSWSPDGKKIAFLSWRHDKISKSGPDIYVMDIVPDKLELVEKNLIRLTKNMAPGPHCPAWSPDGKRIAFAGVSPDNPDLHRDLYIMDTDGKNIKNLTNTAKYSEEHPIWSPDGKMIAFEGGSPFEEGKNVYIIDADGSNLRNLSSKIYGMSPSWSPDSQWIVFHSGVVSFGRDLPIYSAICKIDINGKNLKKLIGSTQKDYYQSPDWSPVK